jgi:hypothetical protein
VTDSRQQSAELKTDAYVAGPVLPGCNTGFFGFVQVLPGFSAQAYGRVIEALGREPLAGLVVHLAGPCAEGWRIVQVWRSADDHARFERERLMPALAETGAFGAVTRAPLVEPVEVSHVLLGAVPMTNSNDS